MDGTVYLLHFDSPIGDVAKAHGTAQHYLGWTTDLAQRLAEHRAGNGARLMAAVAQAGIGFQVAATWEGDRVLERRLKQRKHAARFCPLCRGTHG